MRAPRASRIWTSRASTHEFIADAIAAHDATARQGGASLVQMCGPEECCLLSLAARLYRASCAGGTELLGVIGGGGGSMSGGSAWRAACT